MAGIVEIALQALQDRQLNPSASILISATRSIWFALDVGIEANDRDFQSRDDFWLAIYTGNERVLAGFARDVDRAGAGISPAAQEFATNRVFGFSSASR